MGRKLLSIVVPTKNRTEYVKMFIKNICSFEDERIELVIQDNSDSNEEILQFLNNHKYKDVVYKYDNSPLSMVQNSELAVKQATGKYICFMGDDDLISKYLSDFVEYMDREGYESALFERHALYCWPGVVHKVHKFPSLIVRKYKGYIKKTNVEKEFGGLLFRGATSMSHMPQLYQGVIKKDCLDKIYRITGRYFPAPCPDMAASVALAYVVKKHIYCDMPYILSGVAPKSNAALGAKHMHKAKIENVKSLPGNTAEHWELLVPKIWTGPTIYAESALKVMRNMNKEKDIEHFNYAYFYAHFYVFNNEYRRLLYPLLKKLKLVVRLKYYIYILQIFAYRCYCFIRNLFITRFYWGNYCWDNVPDSFEAEKLVDAKINEIDIQKMFENIR